MTAFLSVETSLTGRRWTGPDPAQDRLAEGMAQQTRLRPPPRRLPSLGAVVPGGPPPPR